MPLSDQQRDLVEDSIMDLHFAAQKYIESEKDIHRKLLELNVQDALDVFKDLSEQIKDDEMKYDYKIHLFIPFHIWEMVTSREKAKAAEES